MTRRVSRPFYAIAFALAALACLPPARRAFFELDRPHDLFPLSLLISVLFTGLFLAALFASLLPSRAQVPARLAWVWDAAIAMLISAFSLLIIVTETPTSFVSWEQWRGCPLPWLENGLFFGPCSDDLCRNYWFLSLKPMPLLINFALAAAAAHHLRRLAFRWGSHGQPDI